MTTPKPKPKIKDTLNLDADVRKKIADKELDAKILQDQKDGIIPDGITIKQYKAVVKQYPGLLGNRQAVEENMQLFPGHGVNIPQPTGNEPGTLDVNPNDISVPGSPTTFINPATGQISNPPVSEFQPNPTVNNASGSGLPALNDQHASQLTLPDVNGNKYKVAYTATPGGYVLQAVGNDGKLFGDFYITQDLHGQIVIQDKFDSAKEYIKNLDKKSFEYVKNLMIQRGIGKVGSSTVKNSDEFINAIMQTLDVTNRNNWSELIAHVDNNGNIDSKSLNINNLNFEPSTTLNTAPIDQRYISEKARAVTELKQAAFNNGLKYDNNTINSWANAVAAGGGTTDDYVNKMRTAAATAFPGFKDALMSGANLRDVATAYIQTASNLLEMPEQSFDLANPSDPVRRALTAQNEKGINQPMNMVAFETMVKQDPRWMHTKNAQTAFANLYDSFSRMLGVGTHGA